MLTLVREPSRDRTRTTSHTGSPLTDLSLSYSPMQGHHASGLPLAATTLVPRYSGNITGVSTDCTAAGSNSLSL